MTTPTTTSHHDARALHHDARPTIPRPGQHLPSSDVVDPHQVHAEVDALLDSLDGGGYGVPPLAQRSRILDEAHEVLVRALNAVDKI